MQVLILSQTSLCGHQGFNIESCCLEACASYFEYYGSDIFLRLQSLVTGAGLEKIHVIGGQLRSSSRGPIREPSFCACLSVCKVEGRDRSYKTFLGPYGPH